MNSIFRILIALALSFAIRSGAATIANLASNGVALQPIVIATNATATVLTAATNLASQLNRITGATFPVQTGNGTIGLAIGRAEDFPALVTGVTFNPADVTKREDYLLRSHANGVWLLGATDAAMRHAAWDFLHRLGYRQFFPGPTWEIVPASSVLAVAVDAFEHPSYYARQMFYGFGTWGYNLQPYNDWCERNRAVQGIQLNTGHAYEGIYARNSNVFTAHPEYLALVGGVRQPPKFANANPGLRALCAQDALTQLTNNPALQSVSMEPSDGGGWDESPESAALGSITDQALSLANYVAAAVAVQHPATLIGMYAYNQHSPPPNIQAHTNVVVSIATAFISGGYTVDQLIDGWSPRVTTLGIREYYSVNQWDRDVPGLARAANATYLRQTITNFHQKGARFMLTEAGDNWGPCGLGYYLAARMWWNVGEATNVEALTADFLQKCFGSASAPMTNFYALLDGAQHPLLSDDLLGRMFRRLDEAWQLTTDNAIRARLDALTLYSHYVELWLAYSSASGAARQAAFEALIRHAYRMRTTEMVHTLALYRDLDSRDATVSIPTNAVWTVPEPTNPWKSSAPFTRGELDAFRTNGIANHALLDFTPVAFSTDLIPATQLGLSSGALGTMGLYSRGVRNFFTWVSNAPATLNLNVQAGIIYTNLGPASLKLFPAAEPQLLSVASATVAPDKMTNAIALNTTYTGLHRIEVSDATAGTLVTWPNGTPMTVISSQETPAALYGRWTLYFYVPRATTNIGGFADSEGTLRNPAGAVALTFTNTNTPGYFNVPVPAGQDGRLWKFDFSAGTRQLLTVPPCLARSAAELLLPREVVASDSGVASTPQETWRFANFRTTANYGAAADTANPDGDEWTNAQEYTLGTNPVSPGAGPLLTATASGGNAVLTFTASQASGASYTGLTRTYDVESTTHLSDPASWSPLAGYANIPGTGQTVIVSQPLIGSRNFYRLKVRLVAQ